MSDMTIYQAIEAAGYSAPEQITWDGKLHRFATDHAKKHSKDGWYVAHDDASGKAAAFGSWRDGGSHTWSNGTGRKLTAAELKDIEDQKKRALAEEKKRRDQAALRAQRVYEQSAPQVDFSAYLERKRITCPDGVRGVQGLSSKALGFDGEEFQVSGLIVPMRDRSGEIRSLQLIPEDAKRSKLFLKGGQTAGCFHLLGDLTGATRILIGEGLATCQSASEATGLPVAVAFSAHNLEKVAQTMRAQNAQAEIVILVDDDEAGHKGAARAAQACGGNQVLPGGGCNDFNDLHATKGLEVVRATILGTAEPQADDVSWRAELIIKHKDDGTQIIPCRVHNLILILENAPEFKGRIRFNEFSGQVALDGQDLEDVGPVKIKALLEKGWIKEKVSTGDIVEALSVVAHRSPFHPVREWLESLTWDGTPRVESFCHDHLGKPDDAYHQAVARALFVSSVLRICKPGCKVDTTTILQGSQGQGKTGLWSVLYSPWYAEVTDNLNSKDFFIGLSGVWCADFGELDQFSKAETTRIKQILTSQSDHYRGLWKGYHKKHPRQCIFVGGTNSDTWQTDPTGGRRFLPIKIDRQIDIEAVASVRDQLWAEAVFIVKADPGKWWDIPNACEHQEESYVGDTWEEIVGRWLSVAYLEWSKEPQSLRGEFRFTAASVLECALKIEPGKHTRADQTRAGNVMRRLGWTPRQAAVKGTRMRFYWPSEAWLMAQSAQPI